MFYIKTVALFPTYDAPKYKYGYQVLIIFGVLAIIGYILLHILQDLRKKVLADDAEEVQGCIRQ